MFVYRVYADGKEFGMDFQTLTKAREILGAYKESFPGIRYSIHRAKLRI